MERIYVGDFVFSKVFYKKVIEKYDKGLKETECYEENLGEHFY